MTSNFKIPLIKCLIGILKVLEMLLNTSRLCNLNNNTDFRKRLSLCLWIHKQIHKTKNLEHNNNIISYQQKTKLGRTSIGSVKENGRTGNQSRTPNYCCNSTGLKLVICGKRTKTEHDLRTRPNQPPQPQKEYL